jgi:hypothetical protein
MVMVEEVSNMYDAFTLGTLSSEYNRLLQNTEIFSKHYIRGVENTIH